MSTIVPSLVPLYRMKIQNPYPKHYLALNNTSAKTESTSKIFMIDCSPTEMQSIREVFPDCGLYLCDFHQNECWGRWFRTTCHGISQHYELLMSAFKKMGESSSVSEYKKHKEYLKCHTIYRENAILCDYISRGGKEIRRYV